MRAFQRCIVDLERINRQRERAITKAVKTVDFRSRALPALDSYGKTGENGVEKSSFSNFDIKKVFYSSVLVDFDGVAHLYLIAFL